MINASSSKETPRAKLEANRERAVKHRAYLNISIEPLLVFSWFKYQGRTVFKTLFFFFFCPLCRVFFWGGLVGINILQKAVLVAYRLVALYMMEKSHKTLEARIWLLN